ncbi:MAG TPA: HAD-IC family P-type ATPase [Candidatus Sulfotelmatobacter sp.]|nr:HAD-IC family P-type ATPase [Candidatus Sulfotelmatobacter sp.]
MGEASTSAPPPAADDDGAARGLTSAEAARRLAQHGANAIADASPSLARRVVEKFWAPVPWMLEAAIVLQVGLAEYVQAAVIAVLLAFNAALGVLQESRAQATLAALKSRLALVASVRRDGRWQTRPVADLVPGDVVALTLGSVVPADVRVIDGGVLLDHSMITGESLPVEGGPGFQSYAGALVRRGAARAEVTGTGADTTFGRTAELVRTAHVVSSQQHAVLRVVRNLAIFNGAIVVLQIAYALFLGLPGLEIVPLALTAILAAIPVALPATFTLATALGARALARLNVLPTRLSAIDEAASMDLLCVDKTGTLTRNRLAVVALKPLDGGDDARLLGLAALASAEAGQDPVDTAIRQAAADAAMGQAAADARAAATLPRLVRFEPFDPAKKLAAASATDPAGAPLRIVKGAFAAVSALSAPVARATDDSLGTPAARATGDAEALEAQGYRVLAVAAGPPDALRLVGLIALSDPPRTDSAALLAELGALGVRAVMVTGDAPATASVVAHAVGLDGPVCGRDALADAHPERCAVFAGVLPEDKFHIVKAFQDAGHVVGMCGDGANDAPALRQAQIGIAVSSATDVAKAAAGIVLTEPGLAGILAAVREGRVTFQRILTYTLRSLTRKIDQLLFLTVGLVMTGHAILTPTLMVIMMAAGDFLAMSATTDNVRPSARPNVWRIDNLTVAGATMGLTNLAFCSAVLAIGKFGLGLDLDTLRTLAAVTLVFSGQAVLYVARERRRLWRSRPSAWLIASSVADVGIIATLATGGILMAPLPVPIAGAVLAAAAVFAVVLDQVKVAAFRRLRMV